MAITVDTRKKLFFWAITILATLLFLEGALQVLSRMLPKVDRLLSETTSSWHVADEQVVQRGNPERPDLDAKGFRNRDVPARAPIVAMGDSHTFSNNVPREQAWPQQLERLSGVRTYQMGFGGYGPTHSWILLEEALEFDPSILIEAVYLGNDFYDSYTIVHKHGKLPEMKSTDPRVLADLENWEAFEAPVVTAYKEYERARLAVRARRFSNWCCPIFPPQSKLDGLVRAISRNLEYVVDDPYEEKTWEKVVRRESKRRYKQILDHGPFQTIFRSPYRLRGLDPGDPRIVEGYRIGTLAIEQLRDEVRRRGVQFLVVIVPIKEFVFDEYVRANGIEMPDSYHQLVAGHQHFHGRLLRFLEEQGIPYLDTTAVLDGALAAGRQPYENTDDGHENLLGYRLVAEAVNSKLLALGYLPLEGAGPDQEAE